MRIAARKLDPCIALAVEPNATKSAFAGGARRKRVDELLPPSVRDELRTQSMKAACIDPAFVKKMDADFAIATSYGVTRRRLAAYLRGLHNGVHVHANHRSHARHGNAGELSRSRLHDHRVRQGLVASILDELFGTLAQSSPDLWDRRAYLMLVGLVYERLATDQREMPTDELVALAKVLAEGRRADACSRERTRLDGREKSKPPSDEPLPGHFSRIIRQVYGANLQDPAGERDDSEPQGVPCTPTEITVPRP